jgi:hypothetical protein
VSDRPEPIGRHFGKNNRERSALNRWPTREPRPSAFGRGGVSRTLIGDPSPGRREGSTSYPRHMGLHGPDSRLRPSQEIAPANEFTWELCVSHAAFSLRLLARGLCGPRLRIGHLRAVARELAFQLSRNSVSHHCVLFPTLGETDLAISASFPRWYAQQHIEPLSAIGISGMHWPTPESFSLRPTWRASRSKSLSAF